MAHFNPVENYQYYVLTKKDVKTIEFKILFPSTKKL